MRWGWQRCIPLNCHVFNVIGKGGGDSREECPSYHVFSVSRERGDESRKGNFSCFLGGGGVKIAEDEQPLLSCI